MGDDHGNLDLRLSEAIQQLRAQEALIVVMGRCPIGHLLTRLLSSSLSEFYRLNAFKRAPVLVGHTIRSS